MNDATTFDARVYLTEVYKGRKVTTYWVRWKVAARCGRRHFGPSPRLTASAAPC